MHLRIFQQYEAQSSETEGADLPCKPYAHEYSLCQLYLEEL